MSEKLLENVEAEVLSNLFEGSYSDNLAATMAYQNLYKDKKPLPQRYTTGVAGVAGRVISFLPKNAGRILMKYLYGILKINSKHMGKYMAKGENIMLYPLLVSENIDQSIVSKFCAMLQLERAEFVRQYFYNNNILNFETDDQIVKEFGTNFYESIDMFVNSFEELEINNEEELEEAFDALVECCFEAREEIEMLMENRSASSAPKSQDDVNKDNIEYHKMRQNSIHHSQKMDLDKRKFEWDIARQGAKDHQHKMNFDQRDKHHDSKLSFDAKQKFLDRLNQKREKAADRKHQIDMKKSDQKFQIQRDKENQKFQLQKDASDKEFQIQRDREKSNYLGRVGQLSVNDSNGGGAIWGSGLKLSTKDLMPISPTNINLFVNKTNGSESHQIVGIRYIPHRIPFTEMKVAFKYGIMNSRLAVRFIKMVTGDISIGNFLTKSDSRALSWELTKISTDKKAWNTALKESTHPVSILITKEEFDYICQNLVDLTKPERFKAFQKDVGMVDLIIVDTDAKEFIRLNAVDNYQMIHYDIRDALNANNKDLVINARIDQSKLRDEDY